MKEIKFLFALITILLPMLLIGQTVEDNAVFELPVLAKDGVGGSYLIIAGIDPAATSGLDRNLGEAERPPFPPGGIFDVRFKFPASDITSLKDIRNGETTFQGQIDYEIIWQLGTGSSGLELSWDLPEGVTMKLTDFFGGIVVNKSFPSGPGQYKVTNTALNSLKLILTFSGNIISGLNIDPVPGFRVFPNYPNPFNPSTTITFELAKSSLINLDILTSNGELIYSSRHFFETGLHNIHYKANNVSGGIYIYRLTSLSEDSPPVSIAGKMTLIK